MSQTDKVPAVLAEHLVKTFPDPEQKGKTVTALNDVNLTVPSGGLVALVGPDGAGKTTFMRLTAALLVPTGGTLRVFGMDPRTQGEEIQKRIAYMPQRFGLYQDLSVKENMDLFADLQGVPEEARKEKYQRLLRMTGLAPFTERPAGKLSGGMKQKLALACSLVHDPDLLILDEPTAGVDPLSRKELWKILKTAVCERGTSVLVSTAYLEEAAMCEEVYIINHGRILAHGTPQSLTEPFKGRVWFAAKPGLTARTMQNYAAETESVLDFTPSGDGVRVLLTPDADLKQTEASLHVPELKPLAPRLEDAFMSLLIADDGRAESFSKTEAPKESIDYANEKPIIVVRDLVKKFGDFTAVDDTSFEVKRGEIFGLLGPNGAGKTTTFRILCGLIPATSGEIEVAGVNLRDARASARERVGYVAQFFSLYGMFPVRYNLRFYGGAYHMSGRILDEAIQKAVHRFGLSDYLNEPASSLNEGYKKRLSMAAALLHDPEILFLDEPTSSIDPIARRVFWRAINQLADEGRAVIVTTHFMEEAEYCTRIAIQDRGRMLAIGSPKEVKAAAGLPETADMNEAFLKIVVERGGDQSL